VLITQVTGGLRTGTVCRSDLQSVSIQPSLEVDEGMRGMTGSRLVDCGSLIMDDSTSLQGCIDGSFTRCVPSRNEAKVEPLAANIFAALIEQRFPIFVVSGDLKPSDLVAQGENGVIGNVLAHPEMEKRRSPLV
jgi:hypothetical protein